MTPTKPPDKRGRRAPPAGWNALADWYDGWMGAEGSDHHRKLAIPATLELLDPQPGERILDVGCGQGVLAPHIAQAGADYTGVDVSPRLLKTARKRHPAGRFIEADAAHLAACPRLRAAHCDALVFLLSIQDMNPLEAVLDSAQWALAPGGRVVILMTHPCFRIPRQSGWGRDEQRKLQYRRIDRYLTPLSIPMKRYPGQARGANISFHRPLSEYINGLGASGLLVDRITELPTYQVSQGDKAQRRAHEEIPLFLGLRARKLG